jgi:hypothetical protein
MSARLRILVVLWATLVGAAAHAGYYMEHESVLPNPATMQPMQATIRSWQEGKRFKRENPLRNEVVIIDLDKHEVVGINSSTKTFWRLPTERYRQLALVSLVVMGVTPKPDGSIEVPDPLFVKTGLTATVEGRKAYQVKVQGKLPAGVETEVWLSEEIPLSTEKLITELRMALGDPKHPSFEQFFQQWRDLKGYPIQNVTSVMTAKGRVMSSETLLSFREETIDAAVFAIPKGYALTEDPITQMERLMKQAPAGIDAPLPKQKAAPSPVPSTPATAPTTTSR